MLKLIAILSLSCIGFSSANAENLYTPSGCGSSDLSVKSMRSHGFLPMVTGTGLGGIGNVVFVNKNTKQLVTLNFKNDQTSCVISVINHVAWVNPPKD